MDTGHIVHFFADSHLKYGGSGHRSAALLSCFHKCFKQRVFRVAKALLTGYQGRRFGPGFRGIFAMAPVLSGLNTRRPRLPALGGDRHYVFNPVRSTPRRVFSWSN